MGYSLVTLRFYRQKSENSLDFRGFEHKSLAFHWLFIGFSFAFHLLSYILSSKSENSLAFCFLGPCGFEHTFIGFSLVFFDTVLSCFHSLVVVVCVWLWIFCNGWCLHYLDKYLLNASWFVPCVEVPIEVTSLNCSFELVGIFKNMALWSKWSSIGGIIEKTCNIMLWSSRCNFYWRFYTWNEAGATPT